MSTTPQWSPEQLEQMARAQAKITEEQRKQKELTGDLADSYDIIEKDLDNISKLINNQLKSQGASARQISEIKSIYNSLNKTNRELQYLNDKFYEGNLRTKDISKQINELNRSETAIRRQINIALDKGDKVLAAKFKKQLKVLDKEKEEAETLKKQNEYVDKRVGLTGKLLSGLEKIPILGEAIDFEEINTNMRSAVGKTNVFGAGLRTAGKQLKEGLRDPLVQFGLLTAFYTKIIRSAYKHNELITNLGRQLGISKDNAQGLYDASFKYAATAHDSFVTATRLVEAQSKLNEALGTAVNLGNKNAEGFARLTHYYKLSEESAGKLTELATEQGKTSLDILNSTARTYINQQKQYGGTIKFNKVLDQVANVSDDIYIRFKGNPEAIAKAVMQADRLGLSLDQVNKIGESLLDFESSIENELKAELLTGKQINLEKAREYALMGDTESLTKEIAKQVGNIHQFEQMNVIERKAYAEAMGMSVQEMASMLRKQEFEAKLSKEAKESAKATLEYADKHGITIDKALRDQYEQKALADEQKEVFEKINEILGKIVEGPMGKFLDMINQALHWVNGIFEKFSKFTGGALGNALGTAMLSAPLLIGASRLIIGLVKTAFLGKPSGRPGDAVHVIDEGGMGDGSGGGSDLGFGERILGKRLSNIGGKRGLFGKFGSTRGGMSLGKSFNKGLKGFGIGTAISIGSSLIASNMEEGTGKDTVSGIGTTAEYAGYGAMLGSVVPGIGNVVGGIVGGVIGAVKGFWDAENNRREREEARKKMEDDQKQRTNDLLEQLALRPNVLNVGGKTIMEFNTAADQYGTRGSSFN